uniref:NADH-ubiquinone oxidoreductase chain 6 n=1 Tax=Paramoeba aparasomata TaxID=2583407 RepID=A0A5P8HBB7_9EUKA|nr:NADH dehydrogenase subunit 6 [Paramoeba aparasomata]
MSIDLSVLFYSLENKIDSLFIVSSGVVLGSSFRVIISKNPINSIISLIIVFFNSVFILMAYEIEFLAMIFLIVYIGAISVLFLFVVYMLNIKILELQELNSKYLQGLFFGFILLIFSCYFYDFFSTGLKSSYFLLSEFESYNYELNWLSYSIFFFGDNLFFISLILYLHYYIILMILGLILLVAMIGSIVLTSSKTVNIKEQSLFIQTKRFIK